MSPRSKLAGAAMLMMLMAMPTGALCEPLPASTGGRAGPDLAVVPGSYNITPNPPMVEDVCVVNVTVINQGDTNAGAFTVAFYRNNTGTALSGANQKRINSLAIGATVNVSCTWDTQTTEFFKYYQGINYTIIVVLDTQSEVAEGDETNNRLDQNQSLGPQRMSDLVLQSCTAAPASLLMGGTVTIQVTMTNIGEVPGKFFKVYCFANDVSQVITYVDVNQLNVAEVKTVSLYWNTSGYAPGDYNVLILVNPQFYFTSIPEPDWTNNNATKPITITHPPIILELGTINLTPAAPHQGDLLTINCTLLNNGSYIAENVSTRILLDSEELSKRNVTLDIKESFSLGAQVDTSIYNEGSYTVRVEAGGLNRTKAFTLLPISRPDLVPRNVTYLPLEPKAGQVLDILQDAANEGTASSAACLLSLFVDYNVTAVNKTQVPALAPGEVRHITLSWNTAGLLAGNHSLRLEVDSGKSVAESNEANNNHVFSIEFSGDLDLALDNLTIRPAAPRAGETVQFSVRIKDIGTLSSASANLSLSVGGTPVDFKSITTLAPGASRDCSLGWPTAGLAPGNYDYKISIEPTCNCTDIDGTNNLLSGTLELLPPPPAPDLRVSNITIPGPSPRSGDDLTLLVTVENAGSSDANASTLMINLERGTAMLKFTDPPVTVPRLASGTSTVINATRNALSYKAGSYKIVASVDYNNDIAEMNESNNVFTMEFTLLEPAAPKPTLSVGTLIIDGNPVEGALLSILASVANTGQTDAYGVTVRLFVDGVAAAGEKTLDQVSKGSSRTAGFTWKAVLGQHKLQVKAEATDAAQASSPESQVTVTAKSTGGGGSGGGQDMTMLYAVAAVAIIAVAGGAAFMLMRRKKTPPAEGPQDRPEAEDKPREEPPSKDSKDEPSEKPPEKDKPSETPSRDAPSEKSS